MCHCANVLFVAEIRNAFFEVKDSVEGVSSVRWAGFIRPSGTASTGGAVPYVGVVKTKTGNQ